MKMVNVLISFIVGLFLGIISGFFLSGHPWAHTAVALIVFYYLMSKIRDCVDWHASIIWCICLFGSAYYGGLALSMHKNIFLAVKHLILSGAGLASAYGYIRWRLR